MLRRLYVLAVAIAFAATMMLACAANITQEPDYNSLDTIPYQIADRGQDFALYRKVGIGPNEFQVPVLQTNQFTLLENALHYQDPTTGEWRQSEDLIESFPDGAIAQRGPHKALFAHELNSQSVFDIQASDGRRIRGGVRAIQLTDSSSGKTITLATVKNSVTGQLLPPNSILWSDAFDGLKADVVFNWKHNAFSHDILLREQPELPMGWNADSTRLEVLTEFIVDAEPTVQKANGVADGQSTDHTFIDFGAMAMIAGKAFPISDGTALNFSGALIPDSDGAPVRKQWVRSDDGRHFVVESLDWKTVSASLKDFSVRRQASETSTSTKRSFARAWPKTPPSLKTRKPIQLASSKYNPRGYLLDFTIISGATPTTLTSGTTYYIQTSYYSGSSLTVQSGAIVKFKNNAYMLLYGSMTFPSAGPKAVFTSRNDDSVGDRIAGVTGETDSNGDPSVHRANPSLWIYYDVNNVTVQNTRFRWCKVGIRNDRGSTATATQNVSNCFFENITGTGSAGTSGDLTKMTVSNLTKCKVDNGHDMTFDCIGIENDWAGDSNWALSNPATAGWPANSGSTTPEIEGFAGATSVNAGNSIDLYVDVRGSSDVNYTIQFYRMGWYNTVGGRKMTWYDSTSGSSVTLLTKTSVKQPVPAIDSSNNGIVDCLATTANGTSQTPWSLSYTLNVPSWWLSGVYLAKLTGQTSGKQSYIIFTVREDSRGSDLYVQSSVNTWQAYNPWGGNSIYPYPYVYLCNGDFRCPSCNPQYYDFGKKVSFNRPYAGSACDSRLAYGIGAGEFLVQINLNPEPGWEYNALRWLEKQGYDITYCTSVDIHQASTSPGSLLNKSIKAFISVGHDEYWSTEMRSNVEAARDRTTNPVNLIFLASNVCYWRIHPDSTYRSFFCEKDTSSPNLDLWRAEAPTWPNNPELSLVGVEYAYNSIWGGTMTLINPVGGHWTFNYTGINPGASQDLTGLLGYEVDGCWIGTPCRDSDTICPNWGTGGQYDTIKLGDSPFTVVLPDHTLCISGHSYMTIYTAINGTTSSAHAQVFATGSMEWNYGLDDFGYYSNGFYPSSRINSTARQVTHNVIRKFTGNSTTLLP